MRGCLITLDALHTTHDTERAIVDVHGADYLFTVKDNCPETCATLNNIALAIVFHRGLRHVPEANLHFMMRREDALDAILSPT